jgi:hypothetical protein
MISSMPAAQRSLLAFLTLFFCGILSVQGATRTCTVSGYWESSSTWNGNTVPGCGDSIVIAAGKTVTVGTQLNFNTGGCSAMKVTVYGNWWFDNGKKIDLPCGSKVYIMSGGSLGGDAGGSSNQVTICGDVYWRQSDGIVTGPTLLPISLLYFNAGLCGTSVCFSWATATEENNDRFEVQWSDDAVNFQSLSEMKSAADGGNSVEKLDYSSSSTVPARSMVYYRLASFDADGKVYYSPITYIDHSAEPLPAFYPNPSNGQVWVSIPEGDASVTVVDCNNALRFQSDVRSTGAAMELPVSLEAGVYLGTISTSSGLTHVKLIVQ